MTRPSKKIPASSHVDVSRQPVKATATAENHSGKGLDGEHGTKLKSRPKAAAVASVAESSGRPDWKTMDRKVKIQMIKKLAAEGCSTSVIAARFQNVTRNAVIGLLTRVEAAEGKAIPRNRGPRNRPTVADVPLTVKKGRQYIRPAVAQAKRAEKNVAVAKSVVVPPDLKMPPVKRGTFDPLPGIKPLPIIDLPNRMRCRWPVEVSNSELHFACGAGTSSDTHVYCAPHRLLSVARSNPRSM